MSSCHDMSPGHDMSSCRDGWGKNAFSIFDGVHFGGWRRQHSAKHAPVEGFSREDGMVRHPHRPKVDQYIGPPRMMEKGQSHGVPPLGALRIKWMRMIAKCIMTDPTVSRPPRPIRMGRFRPKSGPLRMARSDVQLAIVCDLFRNPCIWNVRRCMPSFRVCLPFIIFILQKN